MQRIATATKYVDLFGPGKHGFGEAPEIPLTTHLSPVWFNLVQEELCICLEDQGVTLDDEDFGQLAAALNSWAFSGDVTLKSGSTFTVLSGSDASVAAGANWQFGASPEFIAGAVFGTAGTLQVNTAVTFSCAGPATFSNTTPVALDGGAVIAASKSIAGANSTTTCGPFGTFSGALAQLTSRVEVPEVQIGTGGTAADRRLTVVSKDLNYGATAQRVHYSGAGLAYARGHSDSGASAGSHNITTSAAVAPVDGTSTLQITGKAMIQRIVAGACTITLQREDSPGAGTYTALGSSEQYTVPASGVDPDAWFGFEIARQYTPGSDLLNYRLRISANGGGSVAYRSAVVRVEPA